MHFNIAVKIIFFLLLIIHLYLFIIQLLDVGSDNLIFSRKSALGVNTTPLHFAVSKNSLKQVFNVNTIIF